MNEALVACVGAETRERVCVWSTIGDLGGLCGGAWCDGREQQREQEQEQREGRVRAARWSWWPTPTQLHSGMLLYHLLVDVTQSNGASERAREVQCCRARYLEERCGAEGRREGGRKEGNIVLLLRRWPGIAYCSESIFTCRVCDSLFVQQPQSAPSALHYERLQRSTLVRSPPPRQRSSSSVVSPPRLSPWSRYRRLSIQYPHPYTPTNLPLVYLSGLSPGGPVFHRRRKDTITHRERVATLSHSHTHDHHESAARIAMEASSRFDL